MMPMANALAPTVLVAASFVLAASASEAATVRDCRDCPAMILVPAGSFMMGSRREDATREGTSEERATMERPKHEVAIRSAFFIGVSEVTRNQFAAFVEAAAYRPQGACTTYDRALSAFAASAMRNWESPGFKQTGRDPVVCIDWRDATAYANWLSVKNGKHYRLPTEAEWEYAARGGTQTSRYWGDGRATACAYANVADSAGRRARGDQAPIAEFFPCTDGYAFTAPVATFTANAFGLYDVIGNVWEWTQDCFNPSYTGAPANGAAWLSGDCSRRIARGGSWTSPARHVTVTFRDPDPASYRSSYLGFRVARDR